MKIGVKKYSNQKFLKYFEDKADFVEIMGLEKNNFNFLKNFSIPITIHAQHQGFGVNNADKTNHKKNLSSINHSIKLADKFNSEIIVLHSGRIANKNCSTETARDFIKDLDKRIILENLTGGKQNSLCTTPEQTKEFLKKTNKGFCFDINHAIETALNNKQKDYFQIIKKFLKLKPAYYHFSGQEIKGGKRTHLSFEKSEINHKKILDMLPKDAQIALEVTTDIETTQKDLDFIRSLV